MIRTSKSNHLFDWFVSVLDGGRDLNSLPLSTFGFAASSLRIDGFYDFSPDRQTPKCPYRAQDSEKHRPSMHQGILQRLQEVPRFILILTVVVPAAVEDK